MFGKSKLVLSPKEKAEKAMKQFDLMCSFGFLFYIVAALIEGLGANFVSSPISILLFLSSLAFCILACLVKIYQVEIKNSVMLNQLVKAKV